MSRKKCPRGQRPTYWVWNPGPNGTTPIPYRNKKEAQAQARRVNVPMEMVCTKPGVFGAIGADRKLLEVTPEEKAFDAKMSEALKRGDFTEWERLRWAKYKLTDKRVRKYEAQERREGGHKIEGFSDAKLSIGQQVMTPHGKGVVRSRFTDTVGVQLDDGTYASVPHHMVQVADRRQQFFNGYELPAEGTTKGW